MILNAVFSECHGILSISGEIKAMRHQKVYVNHVHSSFLLSQLAHMWRKQELCDAIITTENNIVSQVNCFLLSLIEVLVLCQVEKIRVKNL